VIGRHTQQLQANHVKLRKRNKMEYGKAPARTARGIPDLMRRALLDARELHVEMKMISDVEIHLDETGSCCRNRPAGMPGMRENTYETGRMQPAGPLTAVFARPV
jgi:hypothetical protein